MKLVKALGALAIAASAAACQHMAAYPDELNTIANLVTSGLGRADFYSVPVDSYNATDGSYCEVYRFRQRLPGADREGSGTVCRYQNQQWVLVDRRFDTPVAGGQAYPPPPPPPSMHPTHPQPQPVHPRPYPPTPPASAPGQWMPMNF